MKPPVMAPRKREGAKMPPEPPEPRVIDVAAIFAISRTRSRAPGRALLSASVMVPYPTPKTLGWKTPMPPTMSPPMAGFQ
jgi:hypothetical protein